jgi:serine/threonine protein kinase
LLTSKDAHASDEIMTDKKDVWAVGVITFLLLSGEFPFIKSNSDLKDPDKMESLKRVRALLLLLDVVNDILDLT